MRSSTGYYKKEKTYIFIYLYFRRAKAVCWFCPERFLDSSGSCKLFPGRYSNECLCYHHNLLLLQGCSNTTLRLRVIVIPTLWLHGYDDHNPVTIQLRLSQPCHYTVMMITNHNPVTTWLRWSQPCHYTVTMITTQSQFYV